MSELPEVDRLRLEVVAAALKVVGSIAATDDEANDADTELDIAVMRHARVLLAEQDELDWKKIEQEKMP